MAMGYLKSAVFEKQVKIHIFIYITLCGFPLF